MICSAVSVRGGWTDEKHAPLPQHIGLYALFVVSGAVIYTLRVEGNFRLHASLFWCIRCLLVGHWSPVKYRPRWTPRAHSADAARSSFIWKLKINLWKDERLSTGRHYVHGPNTDGIRGGAEEKNKADRPPRSIIEKWTASWTQMLDFVIVTVIATAVCLGNMRLLYTRSNTVGADSYSGDGGVGSQKSVATTLPRLFAPLYSILNVDIIKTCIVTSVVFKLAKRI